MKFPKLNWPLWAGFALSVVAFLSYFFAFVWFPVTRDFPWANLLLFAGAAALLLFGLRRAFSGAQQKPTRAKVAGGVLTFLSVAIFGSFLFLFFVFAKQIPAAPSAPQVGQKAPDFTLTDTNNKPVALSELLASRNQNAQPIKGVLLIFYRGYW